MPVPVQIWLFATPVLYPLSAARAALMSSTRWETSASYSSWGRTWTAVRIVGKAGPENCREAP